MVCINKHKVSHGGGEHVKASCSFSPLLHLSHSSGCISFCTFPPDNLLRFTCFQWQPAYFFENKPHMPRSYPSLMFPHLFSHAFPTAPPPGFHVLCPGFCPCLSLPCAPSEQAVTGVTGSTSGRVLCGCSRVLL